MKDQRHKRKESFSVLVVSNTDRSSRQFQISLFAIRLVVFVVFVFLVVLGVLVFQYSTARGRQESLRKELLAQQQTAQALEKEKESILDNGAITHERSREYASYIMEAIVTNRPYKIGGNVLNQGLIDNLPSDACVEVPCLVDGSGITPCHVGALPTQLAAMNMSNISVQLLTIEAAKDRDRKKIYQAAMMDPHTAAELNIPDIISMCDELIAAHGEYMKEY